VRIVPQIGPIRSTRGMKFCKGNAIGPLRGLRRGGIKYGPESCRKILIDEIHVNSDRLSRNHRHKFHLVTTTLTFGQGCSSSDRNQMRYSVGVVMDAINARPRSNNTRHKMRG
jgi:hypothetical protein